MHTTGGGCVGIPTLFQPTSEVMEVLYQVTREWYTWTDKSLVFRDAATLSCNEVVVSRYLVMKLWIAHVTLASKGCLTTSSYSDI